MPELSFREFARKFCVGWGLLFGMFVFAVVQTVLWGLRALGRRCLAAARTVTGTEGSE